MERDLYRGLVICGITFSLQSTVLRNTKAHAIHHNYQTTDILRPTQQLNWQFDLFLHTAVHWQTLVHRKRTNHIIIVIIGEDSYWIRCIERIVAIIAIGDGKYKGIVLPLRGNKSLQSDIRNRIEWTTILVDSGSLL